ncbi:MAG: light-harvesting antenna LH1, beta subunit [Pseudomonadota bacterium]
MAMETDQSVSLSGLTEHEAKVFHGVFMAGFVGFTLIAVVAHLLVWVWRPWFPDPVAAPQATSFLDGVNTLSTFAAPFIG